MPVQSTHLASERDLVFTLMAQLAVGAVLSTMLVRFPWFRRILLTEKRDWPERLIFAASLGLPLTLGVVWRLVLTNNGADGELRHEGEDQVPFAGEMGRLHGHGLFCSQSAVSSLQGVCRSRLAVLLPTGKQPTANLI